MVNRPARSRQHEGSTQIQMSYQWAEMSGIDIAIAAPDNLPRKNFVAVKAVR